MSKIGVLVPATSRDRDWKNIKKTYKWFIDNYNICRK